MSWSWYLYSTLPPPEAVRIAAEYQTALEQFLDDHEVDDELAEADAGGPRPPSPETAATHRATYGATLEPAVATRLSACRATISFDYVRGDPAHNPLQVSALRFFLENLAPCVMDWGDMSLELGEVALAKLARAKSRGRLGAAAPKAKPKPKKAPKPRAARPGELRAIAILDQISRLAEDPEARVDLSRAVEKLSPNAQRYMQLLVEEGVRDDAVAAKTLALAPDTFERAVTDVVAALGKLA